MRSPGRSGGSGPRGITMAPFNLAPHAGGIAYFLVFFLLGMGFGVVLELSGFGDSRKLAAQFYLRDLTVLKVMFTGIITAAVLIHLASAFHLLDLSRVWVNPTYLVPGIVGGLIMGVGFIVGGFCPGTSLVAAGTLKLDGITFVLGGLFGVLIFGETVHLFDGWWHSTYMGRFTLPGWLGLPTGVTVLFLVAMALGMFYLAEIAEARFGNRRATRGRRTVLIAAGSLLALCFVLILKGQPSVEDRWSWISRSGYRQLAGREIFVDPGEVVDLRRDLSLFVRILEVRSEADYNLFHLSGSQRIDLASTNDPGVVRGLLDDSDNTIVFLASNGEKDAALAWKRLRAQGVLNLYVIEGGINHWLEVFPVSPCVAQRIDGGASGAEGRAVEATESERLRYRFLLAVGEQSPSAHPDLARREYVPDCAMASMAGSEGSSVSTFTGRGSPKREYVKKVKIQKKTVAKGGCG
jgi:rhodanese-related sulfurtransferase